MKSTPPTGGRRAKDGATAAHGPTGDVSLVAALWSDEDGATMGEYALTLALIVVAIIGATVGLRDLINNAFNNSAAGMAAAK